jgi:hypothetical protein
LQKKQVKQTRMASTTDFNNSNTIKNKKSTTETGHNKNVANFSAAFQILEEMGSLYNPSNTKIQLAMLNPIRDALQAIISELNHKKPIYKNAVVARKVAIAPLGKLMTKSLNYSKSIAISTTDKENIIKQAIKIRGDLKTKASIAEATATSSNSTSQLSYDIRIANLGAYIKQLASHEVYAPNETEIQIVSLQAVHSNLITLSQAVNTAANALITARAKRNTILYQDEAGVIQIIKEIKAYLKSLGTEGEPYYKAIVKLQFKGL